MKAVILGAGLSGLSCAYHLKSNIKKMGKSFSFSIYEKEKKAGGLCRSEESEGFIFDYTGHLIHLKNKYVETLVKKLLKHNLLRIRRKAWIYSKNTYTRYPFQVNTYGLPIKVIKECLSGFIETQLKNNKERLNIDNTSGLSFYDWIIHNFGRGVAKHFMIPYNRKMWTVDPKEMTCDWIEKFVPLPNIKEVFMGAVTDQSKQFGYNSYFYYPKKGGIQVLSDALSQRIADHLYLGRTVKNICLSDKQIIFDDGKKIKYDYIISTLPLKELILEIIDHVPDDIGKSAGVLKYNSVLNINLGINRENISDKHWVYFPENKFVFYRVGFPMNFSSFMSPPGTSSMYVEISHRKENGFFSNAQKSNKEQMLKRVIGDLIKAGILNKTDKILTSKILDINYAYVIYDGQHKDSVNRIHGFLHKNNIYSIGRYGMWEYSTMEQAILEGKAAAEKMIRGSTL